MELWTGPAVPGSINLLLRERDKREGRNTTLFITLMLLAITSTDLFRNM